MWLNSRNRYGWLNIALHWLAVLAVAGLAASGLWMVELDYYDPWYKRAPDLHRSVGCVLMVLLLVRVALHFARPRPAPHESLRLSERRLSRGMHLVLLALPFAVIAAGYLLSTADGRAVSVFGWFDVPATLTSLPEQEDLAGDWHYRLAMTLLGLASLHAIAAFRHGGLTGSGVVRRMLGAPGYDQSDRTHTE